MNNDEKGVIYAVEKINNDIILSNFTLKENDDWSFTYISNEEYINSQLSSEEYDINLKTFYSNCNIMTKKSFFSKVLGMYLWLFFPTIMMV